ncbi:CRAL/TRIO domain-containing protein [Mytilinidion resinicola]|uniref:Phosphatidylinositol transfer protein SFH5 n=1 Tax=Mytilinidion resinicola TaxID=574789 RepID=A0A6A6Y4W7_9PEZI|nr:CRAL/TRIO domain-containing protein [Mytilinidion resinicola]KAF2803832.1 CRAL/TRIO domain-containing protein [Mytilinidion resinicola]
MSTTEEKPTTEATAAPVASKEVEPVETPAPTTEPKTAAEPPSTTTPVESAPAETTPAITAPETTTTGPTWPETPADHPLSQLFTQLPEILKETDYDEVYGIHLDPTAKPFLTKLILQKFLRANANNIPKATHQLKETLKWRKTYQPLKAADEVFEAKRFAGLGYVTTLEKVPTSSNTTDIATFNIYGAVKDNSSTFGDLDAFIRWRVGLMELGLKKLELEKATVPIPDFGQGADPYQGYQIHDYLSVSFLRQDPVVKAATKKTIETLSAYYPETLSRKFFVNVPVIMGWVFTAVKLIVSKETVKKFTVLSYGEQLAAELGPGIPEVYGGKAAGLDTIAETLKLE